MNMKALVAEFIGTFGLVFIGGGAILAAAGGLVGVAFAHGLILMTMIYAFAHISGAHFNPAVTIAMMVHKRIAPMLGVMYIIAQLIGGAVAGFLLAYIFPQASMEALYGFPTNVPMVWAIVVEAILTFFLVNTIYGVAVHKKATPTVFGIAIGLTVAADILMGGPLTGAAMNPARAFGTALVSGFLNLQPIYWVGPIVGALVASTMHEYLFLEERKK